MNQDRTAPATPTPRRSTTRARILATATELFYANGIRATSADRIIDQAGITKVTFYRHFRSKGDLVVAYLQEQSAAEQAWVRSTLHDDDPLGSLRELATGIGAASCRPGFRGCAFINAAAEYADPADPVRAAVAEHRRWLLETFADLAARARVADVGSAAHQLMLLRDGAMVNGYLGDPESVAESLSAAFASVIEAGTAHDR